MKISQATSKFLGGTAGHPERKILGVSVFAMSKSGKLFRRLQLPSSKMGSGISKASSNPRKEAKTGHEACAKQLLVFNSISDDAVKNVVCFLSDMPRHTDWTSHMSSMTLFSLLQCDASSPRG